MADLQEQWFDLARLGYPGWEHTQAHRVTTNTQGRGPGAKYIRVRMRGSSFDVMLFDIGGGMLQTVARHIDGVEALIAKREAVEPARNPTVAEPLRSIVNSFSAGVER